MSSEAPVFPTRQQLIVGKTFVETLILTIVSIAIRQGIPEEEVTIRLAYRLEQEIAELSLRAPEVYDIFMDYLRKYFREYFGEEVPEPRFKTRNIREELKQHLLRYIDKIFPDYASYEESVIEEKLEPLVARLILVPCKAVFRDLGYIR